MLRPQAPTMHMFTPCSFIDAVALRFCSRLVIAMLLLSGFKPRVMLTACSCILEPYTRYAAFGPEVITNYTYADTALWGNNGVASELYSS